MADWVAIGVAAVSLGVSGWATCYARSSAKSNEVMAAANKAMAEEAKESRVLAAGQRRADMDQVHHDHAPQIPDEIVASVERDQPNGSLVGLLTLAGHKTYRVDGEALFNGGGSTPPFAAVPADPRKPHGAPRALGAGPGSAESGGRPVVVLAAGGRGRGGGVGVPVREADR